MRNGRDSARARSRLHYPWYEALGDLQPGVTPSSRPRLAPVSFTSMSDVKDRRRGATHISSKHQITIPADALRAAGLAVGDRVVAHADGPGRLVLEREHDVLAEFAGA